MRPDQPDRVPMAEPTRRPGEHDAAGPSRDALARRTLLRTVPATIAVGLAGCASLEDALPSDGDDGSTTTFGYGGTTADGSSTTDAGTTTIDVTATTTAVATATRTDTPTASATATGTATATETQTATETATATATTLPEDYGEQGYGQYGFGGTR